MILMAAAKAISLGQTLIIAQRFGVGAEWDTFVAANQVPEQIFNLIAGGALAYAFIPIFGGLLTRGEHDAAWRLASNVMNTVFLLAVGLSVIVFFAAPWLVANVVAPGFPPEGAAQTVGLMRTLLLSLMIFSISGLSIGILQSHQHFLLPALAPVVYDVGILFGAIFLTRRFGVYGIAYGAVLGAAAHLLVQVPGLIRYHMRWRPIINWRDPDLRHVIRLMIPRAMGLALLNLNMLVAINLSSQLGTGAASAYSWGWRLMQLPESLIGTAMGIVIFPTLAILSAAGDRNGKRNAMSGSLRFILLATIPAAFLMIVSGRGLVGLLEGGALDAAGVNAIYSVLVFFAPGVVVHSAAEIAGRSFYADKDTVTPLYVAFLSAVINIGLALTLPGVLGVPGLALANTVAVSIEVLVLLIIQRRRWQGLNENTLAVTAFKALIASIALSATILLMDALLGHLGSTRATMILRIGIELLIGLAVFVVTAFALRMQEILELPRLIARRKEKPKREVLDAAA